MAAKARRLVQGSEAPARLPRTLQSVFDPDASSRSLVTPLPHFDRANRELCSLRCSVAQNINDLFSHPRDEPRFETPGGSRPVDVGPVADEPLPCRRNTDRRAAVRRHPRVLRLSRRSAERVCCSPELRHHRGSPRRGHHALHENVSLRIRQHDLIQRHEPACRDVRSLSDQLGTRPHCRWRSPPDWTRVGL